MKTVELLPGIRSSVLGFGCAPILGAVGRRQAESALATAIDLGITHLDVAPSYGFGEAEGFLGRVLRGRRDRVVLATKFGIEPATIATLLTPLKPLARLVLPKARMIGAAARPAATALPHLGRFFRRAELTAKNLLQSVERSLRALQTDRIEFLLLHEPPLPISAWDELRAAAERLKRAGKIRGFGVAFSRQYGMPSEEVLGGCDVRQFDCSPALEDCGIVAATEGGRPGILFSPFRGAGATADHGAILRQLLQHFPHSIILCSMFTEQHIRSNVLAIKDAIVSSVRD